MLLIALYVLFIAIHIQNMDEHLLKLSALNYTVNK